MERKTCTLKVESEGQVGRLYLRDGVLLDARTGDTSGDRAAITIASWPSPAITIFGTCPERDRTVESRLGFIVMEAMRLRDEAMRSTSWVDEPSNSARRTISEFPVPLPHGGNAVAIVTLDTGAVRSSSGRFPLLDVVAKLVATVYRGELHAIARLGLEDELQELIMTTERYWLLARPLTSDPTHFALLVFDPAKINLGMQRYELEGMLDTLDAWIG